MGIRNRTPIGTLRQQRRSAESANPAEAQKPRAATNLLVRARNLATASVEESNPTSSGKSENLIERLRTVLKSDQSRDIDSLSDFQILQDELSRISQHHQQSRADSARDLVDLAIPRKQIETAAPFRYIVIQGGKTSDDFGPITKLDRAPSSFDLYTENLPKDAAPKSLPLTLLISEPAPETPPVSTLDPAHEAAQFTQNSVNFQAPAKKGSVLPKSLVLSLLDD